MNRKGVTAASSLVVSALSDQLLLARQVTDSAKCVTLHDALLLRMQTNREAADTAAWIAQWQAHHAQHVQENAKFLAWSERFDSSKAEACRAVLAYHHRRHLALSAEDTEAALQIGRLIDAMMQSPFDLLNQLYQQGGGAAPFYPLSGFFESSEWQSCEDVRLLDYARAKIQEMHAALQDKRAQLEAAVVRADAIISTSKALSEASSAVEPGSACLIHGEEQMNPAEHALSALDLAYEECQVALSAVKACVSMPHYDDALTSLPTSVMLLPPESLQALERDLIAMQGIDDVRGEALQLIVFRHDVEAALDFGAKVEALISGQLTAMTVDAVHEEWLAQNHDNRSILQSAKRRLVDAKCKCVTIDDEPSPHMPATALLAKIAVQDAALSALEDRRNQFQRFILAVISNDRTSLVTCLEQDVSLTAQVLLPGSFDKVCLGFLGLKWICPAKCHNLPRCKRCSNIGGWRGEHCSEESCNMCNICLNMGPVRIKRCRNCTGLDCRCDKLCEVCHREDAHVGSDATAAEHVNLRSPTFSGHLSLLFGHNDKTVATTLHKQHASLHSEREDIYSFDASEEVCSRIMSIHHPGASALLLACVFDCVDCALLLVRYGASPVAALAEAAAAGIDPKAFSYEIQEILAGRMVQESMAKDLQELEVALTDSTKAVEQAQLALAAARETCQMVEQQDEELRSRKTRLETFLSNALDEVHAKKSKT